MDSQCWQYPYIRTLVEVLSSVFPVDCQMELAAVPASRKPGRNTIVPVLLLRTSKINLLGLDQKLKFRVMNTRLCRRGEWGSHCSQRVFTEYSDDIVYHS